MILFLVYAWCQWGAGQWKFSPIIQLGQTSLLVYWVHIEFVYGRFSILKKQAQSIPMASLGLLIIFVSMVLLSLAKTRYQDRGEHLSRRFTAMWRRSVEGGAREGNLLTARGLNSHLANRFRQLIGGPERAESCRQIHRP